MQTAGASTDAGVAETVAVPAEVAVPTRSAEPVPIDPAALPTIGWLLGPGQQEATVGGLLNGLSQHLRDRGLPLHRSTLHVRLLHPQFRALTYISRDGVPGVEEIRRAHGVELTDLYLKSPVAAIMEERVDGLRTKLELFDPPFEYTILDELKADGFTDYVAMPLIFSSGRRNMAGFATRQPGGFRTSDLTIIYDSLPALTVLVEARALRLLATNLLDTYVGPDAGVRILSGDIRRGSGMAISAVLWFCDLRGFTTLADRLPLEHLIALLNGYFEIMGGAVQARGGEILKFIGDALLAIFPVDRAAGPDHLAARCQIAMDAALEAMAGMDRLNAQRAAWGQPRLGAGIALHVGEVLYGNIGSSSRLDFTVIGPAVNLVTRLEGLTRVLGRPLVTSAAFAQGLPAAGLVSLGVHPVKGLADPVELFGLPAPGQPAYGRAVTGPSSD